MKITCTITPAEATELAAGVDVPGLTYVVDTELAKGERRIVVADPLHHYYRFDVRASGQPFRQDGGDVILHPVEREEHTRYTYHDIGEPERSHHHAQAS